MKKTSNSEWLVEAKELERKAKALRKKEADFWETVESRKPEVIEKLGLQREEGEQEIEEAFWREVEERKGEIFGRYGLDLNEIEVEKRLAKALRDTAGRYGCTVEDLLTYINSGQQTEYYIRMHKR